jgi:hypothetical protein
MGGVRHTAAAAAAAGASSPDAPVPPELEALAAPHVQSFDYFLDKGLDAVVEGLDPVEVRRAEREGREEEREEEREERGER